MTEPLPAGSLVNPSRTAEVLRKFDLRFIRDLGQNFLIDGNVLNNIVGASDISSEDVVLEVGAGIGTLTEALAAKAGHVITVEIDRRLWPILSETLAAFSNITVIGKDALDLTVDETTTAGRPAIKLIANLPYSAAAPIILKYFIDFENIKEMVVMVQREIAERILAGPGNKNYSGFTIKLKFLAQADMIMPVSRRVFVPVPKVDSAVIKLTRWEKSPVKVDRQRFFDFVGAGFGQRRKQLANALASGRLGLEKADVLKALDKAGLSPTVRAENLSLADFAELVEALAA